MAKNKYRRQSENTAAFPRTVTAAWVYLMFTLFPLIYHDYYFDILETKTKTFSYLTIAMIVLAAGWGIFGGGWFGGRDKGSAAPDAEAASAHKGTGLSAGLPAGLSWTDFFMLAFWIVAGLSTLTAGKYMRQAFTGEEGRYVGFAFISLITAAYFLVTRYLKFSKHMVTAFLVTAWPMCLFGITDFYDMNLLHFKDHMRDTQYKVFSSFIGNINSWTVYAGFAVVVSSVLFVMSRESVKKTFFYFATMLVSMTALTMGSSDNGYLTLAALFGLLPLAAFRTRSGLRRYVLMLAVYFANIARIYRIELVRAEKGLDFIPIEGLFNHIAKLSVLPAVIAVLLILYAALLTLDIRTGRVRAGLPGKQKSVSGKTNAKGSSSGTGTAVPAGSGSSGTGKAAGPAGNGDELPAAFRYVWLAFILLAAAGAAVFLMKVNAGTREAAVLRFGPVGEYLFFDDAWGTQRGYVWRVCLEEFRGQNFLHRLIGIGPDNFSVQMLLHRYKEMAEVTGQIYDSAHNEFLQYLFTVGYLGLAAYIGQLVSSVVTAAREAGALRNGRGSDAGDGPAAESAAAREPYYEAYLWAFAFAVICYAAQSVVNINIPVVSPLLWIFMMLTESLARERRKALR